MRGSHPGSFEIAHDVRDGRALAAASELSERYDLIVVGGGISGLSAAHFYRKQFGPSAKILVAIAVNRWPHGYAYTYNTLFDPEPWAFTTTSDRPAIRGRQPIGSRITIANADAAASPHTHAAINEAYRAVAELKSAITSAPQPN